jgi:uncharacterized protein YciI
MPMRGQAQWEAHAQFMDDLTDDGSILLGGPLGGEDDAKRVLHIMSAPDAVSIEKRLNEDPWTPAHLVTVSIEPFTILLGKKP